jgi:hypothetical protein
MYAKGDCPETIRKKSANRIARKASWIAGEEKESLMMRQQEMQQVSTVL